jgi:DNA-binding transcriptional ArsR family regulator
MRRVEGDVAAPEILLESVPVEMPELPPSLRVSSEEQFKALGHPLRARIVQMTRFRPLTAKQIADELGSTPGAVGHHLQVLERAGLVRVVARRLINNLTVARYYVRTATIFVLDFPRELTGDTPIELVLLDQVRDELLAALPHVREGTLMDAWFPHKQLSPERMRQYWQRIGQLVEDFLREPPDPEGKAYSLFITAFRSPPYMQPHRTPPADSSTADTQPKE